jgi:hypothetical protein
VRLPPYDRLVTDEPDAGGPAPGHEASATPRRSGQPRAAAVSAACLAAAVLVAGFLLVPGGVSRLLGVPPQPPAPVAQVPATGDPAAAIPSDARSAVTALLDERAGALLRHDRGAFLATLDARAPALAARQLAWFDNLSDVPLDSWRYELGAPSGPTAGPARPTSFSHAAFAATVHVAYRLRGHDRVPQRFDQTLTFDRRDGRWLIVGDPDRNVAMSQRSQLWDFGVVRTVTTRYGLVLGLGDRDDLIMLGREVDRAVPKVLAVWRGETEWSGRVVVVVPATEAQLASLLGGRPAQYAKLAAITRGELGTTEDAAPADRVFVNPRAFRRLSSVGRRVIMAHEITHVASRAYTQRGTPKWLSEGMADYVGYRDSGLATRVVAQELAADVRAGRLPAELPADDAFSTTRKDLPQVYEQSWLACRMIVQRYGEHALTRFYRSVGRASNAGWDGTAAVDRAFQELGITRAEFTRDWRDYLERQLR